VDIAKHKTIMVREYALTRSVHGKRV